MEQMLMFCEISKRILNYMASKTTYSSVSLQRTICSLSPFFTAYFSVFLFYFHMQKYISSLEKHFTTTTVLAVEVAVLLYLRQLALFSPWAHLYNCPMFLEVSSVLALTYCPEFCSLEIGQIAPDIFSLRNRRVESMALPSS